MERMGKCDIPRETPVAGWCQGEIFEEMHRELGQRITSAYVYEKNWFWREKIMFTVIE